MDIIATIIGIDFRILSMRYKLKTFHCSMFLLMLRIVDNAVSKLYVTLLTRECWNQGDRLKF